MWIDTQETLDRLVERLASEREIGVDCEMDSMYAYGTSLCLVQIGWPGGEALVDGLADLDRSRLGALFADPAVVTVFHGGENDIGLMRTRWGFEFQGTFDTMVAAQVLGHDGVGLAALLARHFDVHLSKKWQKADWRVRPLASEQAEYARLDVRYLVPLRRLLLTDLERLQRVEEAGCEFRRIAAARFEERPFDPENWVRVKGVRDLDPRLRAVVRELFAARDRIARRLDRAPYRVLDERGMLALARARPQTRAALLSVSGINRRLAPREADELLAAVTAGLAVGEIPLPRASGRRPWELDTDGRLTPEQSATLDALRSWRVERARTRGVDVSRVATTALLVAIARAAPADEAALAALPGMEAWRVREYGADLLSVVARPGAGRESP